MNFNDLPKIGIVFLLVGMFFTIGIVVLVNIGDNSNFAPTTTMTNETFTMPAQNGTVTTAKGYVTSVTSIKNATGQTYGTANYTVTRTGTSATALITLTENGTVCKTGQSCRITYVYEDHTTAAGTAVTNATTALAEIPNNWLLLIAVVVAASIIIGIVVSNLKTER